MMFCQIFFTTSETKHKYYLYTSHIRVAEQLKTKNFRKLGIIWEVSKLHRMIA